MQSRKLFAKGLAEGLTADGAYQRAGFEPNLGNRIRVKANENILKRIDEIRVRVTDIAEWKAVDRMRMLPDIAEKAKTEAPRVTVSAIAEANKMQGNQPKRSGPVLDSVIEADRSLRPLSQW